ncbi:MAG: hypothetical protein HC836_45700 [Richelia sp. RM2_1_2]|nr:hypothetical protein [Richelia sp. RM2_1_2]
MLLLISQVLILQHLIITTSTTDVILATTGTNIDLVLSPSGTGLVVAPSGYNMSTGPASAFATKGYVDGLGFLTNVVEDLTPQLGGDLDMNGNDIVTTSNANINLIPDGTGVINIDGIEHTKRLTAIINDNQASALAIITYNAANYEAAFIDYVIRRSTDGSRTGTLHVINDNTNVALSDTGAEIGDIGVTFSAVVSGGNVEIRYTSTSTTNAGTIAYAVRRWNA